MPALTVFIQVLLDDEVKKLKGSELEKSLKQVKEMVGLDVTAPKLAT